MICEQTLPGWGEGSSWQTTVFLLKGTNSAGTLPFALPSFRLTCRHNGWRQRDHLVTIRGKNRVLRIIGKTEEIESLMKFGATELALACLPPNEEFLFD